MTTFPQHRNKSDIKQSFLKVLCTRTGDFWIGDSALIWWY